MSVEVFERYRDALRRGHQALAAGRLDVARAAYTEARDLATERPAPHVGLGNVLLREGGPADALTQFDTALAGSPRDEAALRGRADALARLGRRTDAAETLDILADVQEAAGRLAAAQASTQQALDLAEQKARRRRLADLTRRLRLAEEAAAATAAPTAQTTRASAAAGAPTNPAAVPATAAAAPTPTGAPEAVATPAPASADTSAPAGITVSGDTPRADGAAAKLGPGEDSAVPGEMAAAVAAERGAEESDAIGAEPPVEAGRPAEEPAAAGEAPREEVAGEAGTPAVGPGAPVAPAPAEEPTPAAKPAPPPVSLMIDADRAFDRGDLPSARREYLAAAAAFEKDGLLAAALDSCYLALAFSPDDPDVHLRLVELYLALGWQATAADKLALLARLVELDDRKGGVRSRIVVLAADHFPDDPRLRRLSARH